MAKQGMKRMERTHTKPENDVPPVPEIQGKAKHGNAQANPIIDGTKAPVLDVVSSSFESGKINPGTDTLSIQFTNELDNPVADDFVLSGGTQSVISVEENTDNSYVLKLSEALDINTLYSLEVNVSDIYEQSYSTIFSFAASAKVLKEWHFDTAAELGGGYTDIYNSTWVAGNLSEAIDADGSMKIVSNAGADWFIMELRSNWARDYIVAGQEYSLSYKIKATNINVLRLTKDDTSTNVKKLTTPTGEYATYTATFTGPSDGKMPVLKMQYADTTKEATINIDDIVLTTAPDQNTITSSTPENGGASDITNIIKVAFSNEMNAESVANPDAVHKVKNCHIEHLGTKGATDAYFAAGGTDPYAVWQWTTVWGYGSASGVINVYDDTTFKSVQRAWYVHSNANFEKPQINVLNNCHLSAGNLQDITVEALGSTTDDKVVLNNCTFDGLYIQASDSPWIYSDMDNQYADHAEYEIILNNCEPLGYQTGARGKALAISSNDTTSASSVTVGGTAADVLFGDYTVKAGGGGLSGLIYGYYDISGILVGMTGTKAVNNTLGRRLGDCSGINKTMTVTFDGVNSVEVIFSKDYTEMSNAAILSEINSVIGVYGEAFEYNVAKEEYYPQFTDKEFKAENTSDTAVKRFAAVCYDTNGGIRAMTSNDSINDFAGIALENIVPGKTGRVLTEGYLNAAQMGVSSVADGNTFGINESGEFVLSDTNTIFECTNNKGWAYFKANV